MMIDRFIGIPAGQVRLQKPKHKKVAPGIYESTHVITLSPSSGLAKESVVPIMKVTALIPQPDGTLQLGMVRRDWDHLVKDGNGRLCVASTDPQSSLLQSAVLEG